MNNKVSIVIPTRNRAGLLRAALRCVQAQTWPDKEVVVVDEASTDGTAALLAAEFPEVRVVHHDVPRGPSGARNGGVAASSGSWIVFCDDDDLMHPGHIEALLQAALAAPDNTLAAGWSRDFAIVGDEVVMGAATRLASGQSSTELLSLLLEPSSPRPVTPGAVLWPRRLFDTLAWDETLKFYEDFDLYGRAMLGGWRMRGYDAGTYFIRVHRGPRITTGGRESTLLSSALYRLKWSSLLQAHPKYQASTAALRNGLMESLISLSGQPAAKELVPRLEAAFREAGGRRLYVTPPPRHWLKRLVGQTVLGVGGPAALRQLLALLEAMRPSHPSFVSGLRPPQTTEDGEAAAFVRQYQ